MDDGRARPEKPRRRPKPATMAEVAQKEGESAGLVIKDMKRLLQTVEQELIAHIEKNHAALTERDRVRGKRRDMQGSRNSPYSVLPFHIDSAGRIGAVAL